MDNSLITYTDCVVAPIYILSMIFLTRYIRDKMYIENKLKKYMLTALSLRFICLLTVTILYQYYYPVGDIIAFYKGALVYRKTFSENPNYGIQLFFTHSNHLSEADLLYISQWKLENYFVRGSNTLMMRIAALLSIFTFNSYVAIGAILTYFSFWGSWKLCLTFCKFYPELYKEMAVTILFVPSVCFWGSGGLAKETILMGSLGYLIHSFYSIFIEKKQLLFVYGQFLGSFILIAWVKVYIALVLIPLLLYWIFAIYQKKIAHIYYKVLAFILLSLPCVVFMYGLSKDDMKFNASQIIRQSFVYQEISKRNRQPRDSYYDLDVTEHTVLGICKTIPKAVNVALFRPYLWEVHKWLMLPVFFESFIISISTLVCIVRISLKGEMGILKKIVNAEIVFCLVFSLILFFIAGFTAYNFGTLSRYRIPALPFYGIALVVLYGSTKGEN
jgi:hypothetical protein